MAEPYRGETFAPAEDWRTGGTKFAFSQLQEVARLLRVLADDADREYRHKRRWPVRFGAAIGGPPQRVYDCMDASRTITDAIHVLEREVEPVPPDSRDEKTGG